MEEVALHRTFEGHHGAVTCVSFLPRQAGVSWGQVVSGSEDGTLKIHNFKENLRPFEFKGHTGAIRAVAVTPGAELVASGGDDRTVRLWRPRVRTGSGVSLGGRTHGGVVRSVAFCAEGNTLATASDDKMVKLWDIPEARFQGTLSGHSNWVRAVAVHPNNGQLIGSCGDDKTVRLWDAAQKRPYLTLYEHTATVNALAFSPDGLLVASGSADSSVKLWDLRTGRLFQHYGPSVAGWWDMDKVGAVNSICFHPSGDFLLSASDDTTLKLLDVPEGRVCCTIQGHFGPVLSTAFSETGELFSSGGSDSSVSIWALSPELSPPVEPTLKGVPLIDDTAPHLSLKEAVTEIKKLDNPPALVKAVMEAVCILFGNVPSWPESRLLLADITFADQLDQFDPTRVPPAHRQLLDQYIEHPDFSPEVVSKVSAAACTLCLWVRSVYSAVLSVEEEALAAARAQRRHQQQLQAAAAAEQGRPLERPRSAGRTAIRERQLQEEQAKQHNAASSIIESAMATVTSTWIEKADLSELKTLCRMPVVPAVPLVLEATCILLQEEPSWATAKRLIAEPGFLQRVNNFDPGMIAPRTAHALAKYIANPCFSPEAVQQSSRAAYGLCLWITYMYTQAVTGQAALTPAKYRGAAPASSDVGAQDSPAGRVRRSPAQAWGPQHSESEDSEDQELDDEDGGNLGEEYSSQSDFHQLHQVGGGGFWQKISEVEEEEEEDDDDDDLDEEEEEEEEEIDENQAVKAGLGTAFQPSSRAQEAPNATAAGAEATMSNSEAISWTLQNMAAQLDVLTRTMVTLEGRLSTVESVPVGQ